MAILEKLKEGLASHSVEETWAIATEVANSLPEEAVIALHGNLGAGKTTFIQGLAKAWGINEQVTSPTFNIFTLYRGTRLLAHLDAYRLEHPSQWEALMVEDFLNAPYCLAVEWPEKLGDYLPEGALHLYLEIQSPGRHWIKSHLGN